MNSAIEEFLQPFGYSLFSPSSGSSVKTSDALREKTVMLYFSAHWCPPCRRFTPILMEFYKKMKENTSENNNMELVFVSLDKSKSEYDDYTKDMPWLCVLYDDDNTRRTKLAQKYKASSIPHLVIVDKCGQVITMDGTQELMEDLEGENFPWRPKTFVDIWPKSVLTKDGELVESSSLDDKYLVLYFSAHWCPPCRGFTPLLSKTYTKWKSQRDDFEVVFVSSDRDQKSFDDYHSEMSFWALPYEHRKEKKALTKLFGISGIPSLLILGPKVEDGGDRPLINDNLRGIVQNYCNSDGDDLSDFPFHPKPYRDLTKDCNNINDTKCLIVLNEYGDDEEQRETIDLVKAVAEKYQQKQKDNNNNNSSNMLFYYAVNSKGIVSQLRSLIKMESKTESPVMVILDIPDDGGFYVSEETGDDDLTVEKILQFVECPGERRQLEK